jgi:signal transduction histidine kinase
VGPSARCARVDVGSSVRTTPARHGARYGRRVNARRRSNGGIVLGALLVGAIVSVVRGPADGGFVACLALALLLAVRHVVGSVRLWRSERRRAALLATTSPEDRARRAVSEERARLAAEIREVVRGDLVRMRDAAQRAAYAWDSAPEVELRLVQREGRAAVGELRRMLGLLRQDDGTGARRAHASGVAAGIRRVDVTLGALAALIVAAEAAANHVQPWPEAAITPATVPLTMLAALTVVGRSLVPGAATLLLAALHTAGTVFGAPVLEGLWMLVTIGPLAWACAATERRRGWAVAAPLALVLALIHKHADLRPENLGIALVVLGVGALGGTAVRLIRMPTEQARHAAELRESELARASTEAVRAARLAVARELHDAVSGAVGVAVMQAGAAEVQLGSNPAAARRALDVVVATCERALVDLAGLVPEGHPDGTAEALDARSDGAEDLHALVERVGTAGLHVHLRLEGDTGAAAGTVHRVVQEALTNVLRHAPGAAAVVTVRTTDGFVRVDVADDGPGPSAGSRPGYGLVGLAERLEHAGGTFTAGPGPDGRGFLVSAEIPGTGLAAVPAVAPASGHERPDDGTRGSRP